MNNNPPKDFKWEMSDEDDEAMINESMMLMSYKANMEAANKAKKDPTPEEIRLAEMEKRSEENEERIITRLMEEQGLTREQATAKLRWPL